MNKISNRMVMNQILSTGFGTKVQDKMWNEFCTDDKMKKAAEARKFRPHPKRVDSDSEASSLNSSPQSESNLELDFYCDKQVRLDVNQKMVNNRKIIAERIAELTNSVKRGVKSQEVKEFTRVHEVKVILDKCQNNIQPEMKKDEVDEAPEKIKDAVQNNQKTTTKEVVPQNCQKTTKEVVPQNNQKTAKEVAAKRSGCYLDVDQKLKSIFEKTFNVIDDISFQLDRGIDLPDGNEDYVRRKTRSAEFSTRFSRNYLYQLGREIEGLQRLIMAGNCACTCTTQKKVHSAHQIILQGLQNYHSHIQTTMPNLTTGKVKELIEKSKSLCEVHRQSLSGSRTQIHVKRLELISTFIEKLTALLEKIQGYAANSSITLLKCNNGTRVSLLSHNTSKPKINARSKKNNLKSRFAMYSDSAFLTNELAWRQATANLAKKKSKVQSRYKTATFKHRPPVEKPHIVTMPPRNKLFGKCASSFIQHTPIQSPIKEENIVTMVGGMAQEEDTDNASEISEKKRLEPILKAFVQKISSGEDVTQDKLETIMSDILRVVRYQNGRTVENGAGNADIAAKMFEYVMKCSMKTDEGQNEVGKKKSDANGLQNKISVSEFGPKNARLICIKDDRSITESPVPKDEEESCQKLKPEVKVIGVSSETQTDVSVSPEEIEKRKQQMSIKISRLPKRELQLPPKDFMIEIIRYKLDLSKYSKGNAMYRKSASVKPWQLLARISDKILDDLLLSVAREIELNDILEKLYESEFH